MSMQHVTVDPRGDDVTYERYSRYETRGDKPGHRFHGNQFGQGGKSGTSANAYHESVAKATTGKGVRNKLPGMSRAKATKVHAELQAKGYAKTTTIEHKAVRELDTADRESYYVYRGAGRSHQRAKLRAQTPGMSAFQDLMNGALQV